MIKFFNALQIVGLYTAAPFIIGWMQKNEFPYSTLAVYLSSAVYVALFFVLTTAIFLMMEKDH